MPPPKDDFTKEAYRIVGSSLSIGKDTWRWRSLTRFQLWKQNGYIRELRRFLTSIRGPFLDLARRGPNGLDSKPVTVTFPVISSGDGPVAAPKTVTISVLSNKEKDEIEIELKKYTKICANLVQTLRKEIGVFVLGGFGRNCCVWAHRRSPEPQTDYRTRSKLPCCRP